MTISPSVRPLFHLNANDPVCPDALVSLSLYCQPSLEATELLIDPLPLPYFIPRRHPPPGPLGVYTFFRCKNVIFWNNILNECLFFRKYSKILQSF